MAPEGPRVPRAGSSPGRAGLRTARQQAGRRGGEVARGAGAGRRAAHPRRTSPLAWWGPSASCWRGPQPPGAAAAAAAARAGNSTPRPPSSIPSLPRQDGEEKVCGRGGVMWDGAGGASRAGWERPGAPTRGGTAAAAARPGTGALGRACWVPRRTRAAVPNPRTPCTLHRATRILNFSLNTVHLAPATLHRLPLTLQPLCCAASSTLY